MIAVAGSVEGIGLAVTFFHDPNPILNVRMQLASQTCYGTHGQFCAVA